LHFQKLLQLRRLLNGTKATVQKTARKQNNGCVVNMLSDRPGLTDLVAILHRSRTCRIAWVLP
jgi:hypothetical protein